MSSIKLSPNASGTGEFTIAAPNSNTNRTLSLPDQTGTVLTNAGPFTANASASNGAVTIDASNNVGIGVTPSAWQASRKALQVVNSSLHNISGNTFVANNFYSDGTSRYIANGFAGLYGQESNGSHAWYTAPSGTAGNAITWTQAMTLESSGNLLLNFAGGYFNTIDRGLTIVAGGYASTSTKARTVHIGGVGDNGNRCGWTPYAVKTNGAGHGAEYYIRPVTWSGTAFAEQTSAGVYLTDNATSWSSASDERIKDIIEPITDAANKVASLRAVIGKYKTDDEGARRTFLIAQDVQAVLPEAVKAQEDEQGTLGLAYTDVIPLLVAAIKEQQAMIVELKAEVDALKAQLASDGPSNGAQA